MSKIENFLLLNNHEENKTLIEVIEQYLKEVNLLVSNLHTTYFVDNWNKAVSLPKKGKLYDVSWYKNILIASSILVDRLNGEDIVDKNYELSLTDYSNVTFNSLFDKWNKIIEIVKFNTNEFEWAEFNKRYEINQSTVRLEKLAHHNVQLDMDEFNKVSLNISIYPTSPVKFGDEEKSIVSDIKKWNLKNIELSFNWLKSNQRNIRTYKVKTKMKPIQNHELTHINKMLDTLNTYLDENQKPINKITKLLPQEEKVVDTIETKVENIESHNFKEEIITEEIVEPIASELKEVVDKIEVVERKLNELSNAKEISKEEKNKYEELIKVAIHTLPKNLQDKINKNLKDVVRSAEAA
ncbi:MAG: hypothetical protein ACRC4L_00775 [Mycoplasma sp.]